MEKMKIMKNLIIFTNENDFDFSKFHKLHNLNNESF